MEKKIYADSDQLSKAYADWLMQRIASSNSGRFTISLSGGSTPKKLFRLLASEPYKSGIDWSKLHFFWGDERFVPYSDERNNAHMAFDELLDKVPVVREQIHLMQTEMEPSAAVSSYNGILKQYFAESGSSFDLVMLGLGDNSHTLSLFPGYPVVHEDKAWVSAFFLEEQDMFRITLTRAIVNRSACITYLVAGADKAQAVKAVIEGDYDPDLHPAQVIRTDGELIWFLDRAAATAL